MQDGPSKMSNIPLARPAKNAQPNGSTADCTGLRWSDGRLRAARERIVVEEPLCVEVAYERAGQEVTRVLSVTMRTPGSDEELALGFLYCEAIVDNARDVIGGVLLDVNSRGQKIPTWRARLRRPPSSQEVERVSRGIITSAACGVCGRTSLEGLRAARTHGSASQASIACEAVDALPERLESLQVLYPGTGGCHGAGLFNEDGVAVFVREDVGRHNAVDKVIGAALAAEIPASGMTLVLSGRAGFELVQKAAAAGIGLVVAVGAPSSLAVALASKSAITLIGFARDRRFNVYTQAGRPVSG